MTIKVNGPNGVTINFPDGTDQATIASAFGDSQKKDQPDQPPSFGSKAMDVAGRVGSALTTTMGIPMRPEDFSSIARGAVHGAEDIIGTPGDVSEVQNSAIDAGLGLAGVDPEGTAAKGVKFVGGLLNPLTAGGAMPTSKQVRRAEESVTGGLGKSKSALGEAEEAVGEQLPGSLIGPGSAAVKAGGAVLSGLGSLAGRKVTEGTGHEDIGSAVGGTLGGLAAGAGEIANATRAGRSALHDLPAIKAESQRAYQILDNFDQYPVVTRGPGGRATITLVRNMPERDRIILAGDIFDEIENGAHKLPREAAPLTWSIVTRYLGSPGDRPFNTLVHLHEALGSFARGSKDASERLAAGVAREQIRDFIRGLGLGPTMKTALANWSWYARISDVEEALGKAERRAAVTGTGANVQNTMRQEINKMINKRADYERLPPAIREQMLRIVMGSVPENAARWAGRFAPTGLHSSAAYVIASQLINAPLAAGAAGTGYAAKKIGDYLTHAEIQKLVTMMMEEAPINQPIAATNAARAAGAKQGAIAATVRGGVGGYEAGSAGDVNDTLDNPSGIPLQ